VKMLDEFVWFFVSKSISQDRWWTGKNRSIGLECGENMRKCKSRGIETRGWGGGLIEKYRNPGKKLTYKCEQKSKTIQAFPHRAQSYRCI
jgi:hypothetical protein